MNQSASIAAQSFAIIRAQLRAEGLSPDPAIAPVIERMIHTTADFEFARITRMSSGAVDAGVAALRAGSPIVTDVQMVRVGISAPRMADQGGAVHCFVADEEVKERAAQAGITRSAMGMRLAAERGLLDQGIVAIGNAPTALHEVIRLIGDGLRPALVIGVPVGFVGTAESKAALVEVTAVPWIVTFGRKGGSPVAAAVVNALLRMAIGDDAADI